MFIFLDPVSFLRETVCLFVRSIFIFREAVFSFFHLGKCPRKQFFHVFHFRGFGNMVLKRHLDRCSLVARFAFAAAFAGLMQFFLLLLLTCFLLFFSRCCCCFAAAIRCFASVLAALLLPFAAVFSDEAFAAAAFTAAAFSAVFTVAVRSVAFFCSCSPFSCFFLPLLLPLLLRLLLVLLLCCCLCCFAAGFAASLIVFSACSAAFCCCYVLLLLLLSLFFAAVSACMLYWRFSKASFFVSIHFH